MRNLHADCDLLWVANRTRHRTALVARTCARPEQTENPSTSDDGLDDEYDFYGAIRGYLDAAAEIAEIEPFGQTLDRVLLC
jgi:hypothetical protein